MMPVLKVDKVTISYSQAYVDALKEKLANAEAALKAVTETAKNSGEVAGWFVKVQLHNGKTIYHQQDDEENARKYAKFHSGSAVKLYATPANSRATAWYRGVYQPSTPNGPEEYEVDMVWGEDAPDGDNWLPLYATPANSRAEAIEVYAEYFDAVEGFGVDGDFNKKVERLNAAKKAVQAIRALLQQEGE